MDDLEDIRRRKLQEHQRHQAGERDQDAEAEQAAQEAAVERLLQQILEPEARERLTRIRMSRPDLADQVVRQLVALAQGGRLQGRLSDGDLRQVLTRLSPKDRDYTITRR